MRVAETNREGLADPVSTRVSETVSTSVEERRTVSRREAEGTMDKEAEATTVALTKSEGFTVFETSRVGARVYELTMLSEGRMYWVRVRETVGTSERDETESGMSVT